MDFTSFFFFKAFDDLFMVRKPNNITIAVGSLS